MDNYFKHFYPTMQHFYYFGNLLSARMKFKTLLLISNLAIIHFGFAQSVTTIAGIQYSDSGKFNSTANNPIADEYYSRPVSLAFDNNNRIYVTDEHNVMLIDGSVSRNRGGFRGDPYSFQALGSADGTGLVSRFTTPSGVAVHKTSNDVYICDKDNCLIRKGIRYVNSSNEAVWTTLTGQVSFLGGYKDGNVSVAEFASPEDIEITSKGIFYICDFANHCIRKIDAGIVSTVAGIGGVDPDFKDANGTNARFAYPHGISLENDSSLLVADRNNGRIRRINLKNGDVSTVVSGLNFPLDVLNIDGNIFILEETCIKYYDGTSVKLYAGSATESGYVNGDALDARFGKLLHFSFRTSDESIYLADNGNNVIRRVPLILSAKAIFTANNVQPIVNQTIVLTSTSINATTLKWDISPSTYVLQVGSTLSDPIVYVTFNTAGAYTIKLTASNISTSITETKLNYINVSTNSSAKPSVDFTATDLVPLINQVVTLVDLTANNPNSYAWTITPSTYKYESGSSSTDRFPKVKFNTVGLYNIKLLATNTFGDHTVTKNSYINVVLNSENNFFSEPISVFPNPSSGQFFIKGLPLNAEVLIYDVSGRLVRTLMNSNSELLEINLNSGVYFIQATGNQNRLNLGKIIIN
jgi:sugar lactone lactonase YvrE